MLDFLKKNKPIRSPQKEDAFQQTYFLMAEGVHQLKQFYHFHEPFEIIEENLDEVRFFEDLNERRRLDAEVLSCIAANVPPGNMLDIGTYKGHSAARMAVNSPQSYVFTVNIHPDELQQGGTLVTGVPPINDIGIFYREHNLQNVTQIFANTRTWQVPAEINELSLVYIDGCHDREYVYSDTKLIIDRVQSGGFILWHDCSPLYRKNYPWIHQVMLALEQLISENVLTPFILNVKHSWIGIWRKQ